MSEKLIASYTAEELHAMRLRGESRTDWARLDAMTEDELEAAIASDPDWLDIPDDWLLGPDVVAVPAPEPEPVVVDPTVTRWFRKQGGDYAARINEVLRDYVREHSPG